MEGCTGFEMMRWVKGQLKKGPPRQSVATFPSMSRMRPLLLTPTQTVMLDVIDKLEKLYGDGCLENASQQVRPTDDGEYDHPNPLQNQDITSINGSCKVGPFHLTRNRLEEMPVDTSTPR